MNRTHSTRTPSFLTFEMDTAAAPSKSSTPATSAEAITYEPYRSEDQLLLLMALVAKDLSEPYSIFTYRYFVNQWPELSFLVHHASPLIGTCSFIALGGFS